MTLHFESPEKSLKNVHRGVQTTEQSWRHDEEQACREMETHTNETHREDINKCASSHTFHFFVSSALGTLLMSSRSMRVEKHKGRKFIRAMFKKGAETFLLSGFTVSSVDR